MTPDERTILIVEDDPAIAQGLSLNLELEGYQPLIVGDGETALATARSHGLELILLDISLPTISGLDVLSALRKQGDSTPVIVLSARQDEADKVVALRLGADDYVTKPFGVAELLARIGSVLRRSTQTSGGEAEIERLGIIGFSGVSVDLDQRVVTRDGAPVALTHLEFELLKFLVQNASRVFSRRELLREVWGVRHGGSSRTVDNFIAHLRTKLEENSDQPRHIVTVRGSGYRFDR